MTVSCHADPHSLICETRPGYFKQAQPGAFRLAPGFKAVEIVHGKPRQALEVNQSALTHMVFSCKRSTDDVERAG
jgi:hypothetical protein